MISEARVRLLRSLGRIEDRRASMLVDGLLDGGDADEAVEGDRGAPAKHLTTLPVLHGGEMNDAVSMGYTRCPSLKRASVVTIMVRRRAYGYMGCARFRRLVSGCGQIAVPM
jgi:hypothetical protein